MGCPIKLGQMLEALYPFGRRLLALPINATSKSTIYMKKKATVKRSASGNIKKSSKSSNKSASGVSKSIGSLMSDQRIFLEGFKDAVGEILVDCTAIMPTAATPSKVVCN